MEEGKLSLALRIPCFMFDCRARLRPAAFFDIAQELAALGSEQAHFSDGEIASHGLVWILARMSVRFDCMLCRLDCVTASTWHRGFNGLFFARDYQLLSEDGEIAVSATSDWVIMDKESRRIMRRERVAGVIPFEAQCEDCAMGEPCGKVVPPPRTAFKPAGEHKVLYSDLDYNGHVNNARYVVWALDTLPPEITFRCSVRSLEINFNHEVLPASVVALFCARDGDTFYVEGRSSGVQNFICRVIMCRNDSVRDSV